MIARYITHLVNVSTIIKAMENAFHTAQYIIFVNYDFIHHEFAYELNRQIHKLDDDAFIISIEHLRLAKKYVEHSIIANLILADYRVDIGASISNVMDQFFGQRARLITCQRIKNIGPKYMRFIIKALKLSKSVIPVGLLSQGNISRIDTFEVFHQLQVNYLIH